MMGAKADSFALRSARRNLRSSCHAGSAMREGLGPNLMLCQLWTTHLLELEQSPKFGSFPAGLPAEQVTPVLTAGPYRETHTGKCTIPFSSLSNSPTFFIVNHGSCPPKGILYILSFNSLQLITFNPCSRLLFSATVGQPIHLTFLFSFHILIKTPFFPVSVRPR